MSTCAQGTRGVGEKGSRHVPPSLQPVAHHVQAAVVGRERVRGEVLVLEQPPPDRLESHLLERRDPRVAEEALDVALVEVDGTNHSRAARCSCFWISAFSLTLTA